MTSSQIEISGDGPLLVFGGPYSNLAALEALIGEARRLGIPPERAICTGDVVAYGAEPAESVALIRDWGCHVVQGNCEQSLAERRNDCGCNFENGTACELLSKGWFPYADARIDDDARRWMSSLPGSLEFAWCGASFRVVHGGVQDVARWVFASEPEIVDEEVSNSRANVTIAGHSGIPFAASRPGGWWFNPGVIGMPANDGTPQVWYGLVSVGGIGRPIRLTTHRLAYDHMKSAAAMRRAGHANAYARTLVTGIWPSFDVLPAAERAATGHAITPLSALVDIELPVEENTPID